MNSDTIIHSSTLQGPFFWYVRGAFKKIYWVMFEVVYLSEDLFQGFYLPNG